MGRKKVSTICPKCKKDFRTKTHLNRHILSYSKEKLFTCIKCHHSFGRPDHFKQHFLSHDPKNHPQCQYCYQKRNSPQAMKYHLKTCKVKRYILNTQSLIMKPNIINNEIKQYDNPSITNLINQQQQSIVIYEKNQQQVQQEPNNIPLVEFDKKTLKKDDISFGNLSTDTFDNKQKQKWLI